MERVQVVGDHISIKFKQPYPQEDFKERTQFRVKGWRFIPAVKNGRWDGYVNMLKYHSISTGLYRAIKSKLEHECEVEFDESIKWPQLPEFESGIVSQREWQNECSAEMCRAMAVGGGTIIAATSSGKTGMAAIFYSQVPGNHLFLVDQKKLLHQARAEISERLGEPVGIVGDGEFEIERVTVATVQTLRGQEKRERLKQYMGQLETVIVDELHVQLADSNFSIVNELRPHARFGLTATLQMSDLEVWLKATSFSGPVIYTYDIARGMAEGILASCEYHQVRFPPKVSPSKIKANRDAIKLAKEYRAKYEDDDDPEYDIDIPERIDGWYENVLNHEGKYQGLRWLTRGYLKRGRYIVVLADKLKHIDRLARELHEFNPMVITGRVKIKETNAYIDLFEQGVNRLIIASRVFNKGVSIRRIDTVMNVGEIEDENTIVQQIGRELRLHVDKSKAIFVDFGTSTGRYRETAQRRYQSVVAAGIDAHVWDWARQRDEFFAAVAPKVIK